MFVVLMLVAGCAGVPPAGPVTTSGHSAPAKCSACHLAPREHALPADRWERFVTNHKRRIRLTEEEKAVLHGFLVGGDPPVRLGK